MHDSPVTLARRHADRAPDRRVRSAHGADVLALSNARRPAARVQGQPRVDLVGRRLRRRQRPDPGRADRGRRRRRAAARQLHRVLGRRRGARRDPGRARCRSASTGSRSSRRRSRPARCACSRSRARSGCRRSTSPTLREQGVDVEFENWRSVVAPPGIDAAERARLAAVVAAMVRSPEWREMLERFRWLDRYLAGRRVRGVRRRRGAARARRAARARHRRCRRRRLAGSPIPIFVLAGLAVFGAAVAARALRVRTRRAMLRARPRWRSLGLVGVGVALSLAARRDRAGFIVAAALLFWLVARAFDARHPLARRALRRWRRGRRPTRCSRTRCKLPLPAGVLATWL